MSDRRAAPLTHIVYHVLLALATGDRHGYGVIKFVEQITDGRLQLEAGTLYAAIKRLTDDGWTAEVPAAVGSTPRRRVYRITKEGRSALLTECDRLDAMLCLAKEAKIWTAASAVRTAGQTG